MSELTEALECVFEEMFPIYDWQSEHLKDTPRRWAQMMNQLTTKEDFKFTTFEAESDEMIIVKDITFTSVCAHHLAPFSGRAQVGYVPNVRMAGLSKLARAVRYCAAELTNQEALTREISLMLERSLQPRGVAVVLEAEHTCMTIRGVKAPGSLTITSKMSGVFADHSRLARSEFMSLIKS